VRARELQSDGRYVRVARRPGQRRLEAQERLLERARQAAAREALRAGRRR
jgi:hypothetical protein